MDCASGYWAIPVEKETQEKLAFLTPVGLYAPVRMPFGIKTGPAYYARLMDAILAGLRWQCCLVYIDDILVFSPTFEAHIADLNSVFDRLDQAGIRLKA